MAAFEIPKKYSKLWKLVEPLLKNGRSGDFEHAQAIIKLILEYEGKLKFDPGVLVPTAMLHDIGHIAVLPEHMKYITGKDKIPNSKLVHMLTGSKIAQEVLDKSKYDKKKSKEIVEIISIHDMDQLKGIDSKSFYNSKHKRIFHDFDAFDRYNADRIKRMSKLIGNKKKFLGDLKLMLDMFFFEEFRVLAEKNLAKMS